MSRTIPKFLTSFVVLAVVALVLVTWLVSSQSGGLPPALPSPNGYETLLKAANMLKEGGDYATMSEDAMRAALTNDAEALNEAKIALKQESRVIVDYSPASSRHIEALSRMKRLAQVFVAQGRVAKMDRQPRAGAHAYLDVIRLGHQLERGGTIIDSMVAVAVEALGCSALEKLSLQLNAEECREIAAALEAAETRRESIQAILAQEKAWARRAYGFTGVFTRLLTFKQLKAGEQRWAAKRTSQQVRTQRLLIKLASRAYELENGESPKNVSDLVPGYLKTAGSEPLPQLSPKP